MANDTTPMITIAAIAIIDNSRVFVYDIRLILLLEIVDKLYPLCLV